MKTEPMLGRCLNSLGFVLQSVEAFGWSKVLQTLYLQELIRLDTGLRVLTAHSKFEPQIPPLQTRIQNIIERLQQPRQLAWPLLVVRGRRLLLAVATKLEIQPQTGATLFQQVSAAILYGPILGLTKSMGVTAPEAERLQPCARAIIETLWKISTPNTCLKGEVQTSECLPGEIAIGQAYFISEFKRQLHLRPGLISESAWTYLAPHFKAATCFMCEGSRVELLALQQLLWHAQTKAAFALNFLLVEQKAQPEQLQLICLQDKSSEPLFAESLLIARIQLVLPHLRIEQVLQQPAQFQGTSTQSSRPTDFNKGAKLAVVVDKDLQPCGYSLELSWSLACGLLARSQADDSQRMMIFEVKSLQALKNIEHWLSSHDYKGSFVFYFKIEALVTVPLDQVLQVCRALVGFKGIKIGLYSEKPQDMFRMQFWSGVLDQVLLGPIWFKELQSPLMTIRGNGEARLRHLMNEGWALAGYDIADYATPATSLRLGVQHMSLHPQLKQDIFNQTHLTAVHYSTS